MQVYLLNSLPDFGYSYYIYYLKTDGKYYGWDAQNNRFYNLSTPNIDDLLGLSFENLQEGDVLSYDSVSKTWINKVINTSIGVNSFNNRQGDVYLLSSDVTDALGYTPEDLANKQNDLTPSSIKYPTVDAVNAGLLTKEPAITSGTFSEYWRGDKTFQTLDKNAIGLNNVDNTSDANKPISTLQATAIGLKEDSSNKSTSTTDSASTTKFPVWSAIVSYFDISRIKTILGITTLSGSNTGDQDLSGLVVKNNDITAATKTKITYDIKGLVTNGADATTADIADSSNKRYVTDSQLIVIGNTSGINTGDQTLGSLNAEDLANKATNFSTVNDTLYPSVKAVDDHINSKLIGLWDDRGSYDASVNLFPSSGGSGTAGAIMKGDIWTINVQGTLGGIVMHVGDTVRALVDSPAQTTANWALLENAIGYVPEDVTNKVTTFGGNTTSDIKYPSVKAIVDNYTSSNIKSILGITTLSGSNTGDQDLSGLVVKNTDIVGATKTKITYDAKGLVTNGEDATTADIADTLNKRYITDAQLTVLGNTSGTNTGDNATNSQYSGLAASKQDVLGFTPENLANKSTNVNTDQSSDTKYPSVKSVYDWATIVFTTTSAVATQITTALVGYATQSWVNSQGFITSVIGSLGYTPENEANKENTILDTSTIKYPTNNLVKTAVDSKVTANASITGDTKTKITYDSQGLITSSTDATTDDIADGFDKRYVTDANLLVINNTSGINTGDQTLSGLGGVPTSRNITVNGTISNLSADSTFTVTDANLSTSDITTNNVSTTKHGFAPKLANNTTQFLRADGSWASPNVSLSVQSVASSATVTPTSDNNIVVITAQAAALTMAIPTGTPVQGQALMIRIKDNGTARAITWTTGTGGYRAIGVTLPTTTVINKTTYVGLIYNSTDSRWDAIGVATEA